MSKNILFPYETRNFFYPVKKLPYKPLELKKNNSNKQLTPNFFPRILSIYGKSHKNNPNFATKTFFVNDTKQRKRINENKKVAEMSKFEFQQFLQQYADLTKGNIKKLKKDNNPYNLKPTKMIELRPISRESYNLYYNSNKTFEHPNHQQKLNSTLMNKFKTNHPNNNTLRTNDVPRAQSSAAFTKPLKIMSNLETIHTVENTTEENYNNINNNKLSSYILGKVIGKGAYATVKLCYNKETKKNYAVKIYDNILMSSNPSKKTSVYKEIQVLKEINHKNLIKLYDFFEQEKSLYLVMEQAKGISLQSFLKSLPNHRVDELRGKRIFSQIMSALSYIHKKNICHRDIKMENIIIDDCLNIKLIDFGFGIHFKSLDSKLNLFCGTPNYMPPEIIKKVEYYGPPADMWSAGIVLFNLLCGTFPFRGQNEKELFNKICNGTFQIPNSVSVSAHNMLQKLLCLNPKKRITAENALKHEWIVNMMDVFSYNLKKK